MTAHFWFKSTRSSGLVHSEHLSEHNVADLSLGIGASAACNSGSRASQGVGRPSVLISTEAENRSRQQPALLCLPFDAEFLEISLHDSPYFILTSAAFGVLQAAVCSYDVAAVFWI